MADENRKVEKIALFQALDAEIRGVNPEQSAPSLETLDNLARVLAAYVRGASGGPDQGPKHAMQLVNKNSLSEIIDLVESTMPNDFRIRLRKACVGLVADAVGATGAYRWKGHDLKIGDWAKAMNERNIDLVAVYDTAYRSAQIGGLADLNTYPPSGDEPSLSAPVIEFRDLGSKKPSEMKAVFESIIKELG